MAPLYGLPLMLQENETRTPSRLAVDPPELKIQSIPALPLLILPYVRLQGSGETEKEAVGEVEPPPPPPPPPPGTIDVVELVLVDDVLVVEQPAGGAPP